jgi:hypothetical protein
VQRFASCRSARQLEGALMASMQSHKAALIGKAGEALVAGELMRRGVDVAYSAVDDGVDLIAFNGRSPDRLIPVQVKTSSATLYSFEKKWFCAPNLVLIQVWHAASAPQFFIFENLQDVELVLGKHALSKSWQVDGGFSVTSPTERHLQKMEPFGSPDRWLRLANRLGINPGPFSGRR